MNDNKAALYGQVALVTGGGRGIGRTIALALAEAGAAVVALARNANEVAETTAQIHAGGGRAIGVVADVTNRADVERCVQEAQSVLGPIDLLINNAGVSGPGTPLWETDPEEWWRTLEINLRGPLLCARAVLPSMIQRRTGTIINVGSNAGIHANTVPAAAYATSKAALIRFTDSLAASTNAYNVRVFTISPGLVHTAMTDSTDLFKTLPESAWSPVEAAAALVIRLASTPGTALNGKFIHVKDDFDELLRESERIEQEELYTLRLLKLTGPV